MGEPLNNWEPVKSAVRMMVDSRCFALARSKVRPPSIALIFQPNVQLTETMPCKPTQALRSPGACLFRCCRFSTGKECASIAGSGGAEAHARARTQVTVSTVGVVPRIRALAAELPGVSLALSLHAPNQALRQRIVPSARAYPLDRLMAAVSEYQAASGQRVWQGSVDV